MDKTLIELITEALRQLDSIRDRLEADHATRVELDLLNEKLEEIQKRLYAD